MAHPDAVVLESLPLNFSDLLASSDVLLCKPGYGSFAEAACSGIPALYVNRPDWPEAPALIEWLQQTACAAKFRANNWKAAISRRTCPALLVCTSSQPTGGQWGRPSR